MHPDEIIKALEERVRALESAIARMDAVRTRDTDDGRLYTCIFCGNAKWTWTVEHVPDCPWIALQGKPHIV